MPNATPQWGQSRIFTRPNLRSITKRLSSTGDPVAIGHATFWRACVKNQLGPFHTGYPIDHDVSRRACTKHQLGPLRTGYPNDHEVSRRACTKHQLEPPTGLRWVSGTHRTHIQAKVIHPNGYRCKPGRRRRHPQGLTYSQRSTPVGWTSRTILPSAASGQGGAPLHTSRR